MARYGPTPLAPEPYDPTFLAYLQFVSRKVSVGEG